MTDALAAALERIERFGPDLVALVQEVCVKLALLPEADAAALEQAVSGSATKGNPPPGAQLGKSAGRHPVGTRDLFLRELVRCEDAEAVRSCCKRWLKEAGKESGTERDGRAPAMENVEKRWRLLTLMRGVRDTHAAAALGLQLRTVHDWRRDAQPAQNQQTGWPLDGRRADVMAELRRDRFRSDRAIAMLLGVNHMLVNRVRREMVEAGEDVARAA